MTNEIDRPIPNPNYRGFAEPRERRWFYETFGIAPNRLLDKLFARFGVYVLDIIAFDQLLTDRFGYDPDSELSTEEFLEARFGPGTAARLMANFI